jgi:hypothetical protein
MNCYSHRPANPRSARKLPCYPAAVGLCALLILGASGCTRGQPSLGSPGGDIAVAMDAGLPAVNPAVSNDPPIPSLPEPTTKGDIAPAFHDGGKR